ncbi:MAG: rhomboid family intramembrane serine protease [Planctomycetota bacterium]|nr:rhomboid family intramembrane serine protease [Planctomycetota bacterium]
MRQIGTLPNENAARRFTAFLLTQNITASPEQDAEEWIIWVHDENNVERGHEALEDFRQDPNGEIYLRAETAAEQIVRKRLETEKQNQKNVRDLRGQWNRPSGQRRPLTLAVLILTVLVFFITGTGVSRRSSRLERTSPSASSSLYDSLLFCSRRGYRGDPLASIKKGQIWRLVTPILLHGSALHLLFNMYWLFQLGGMIESCRGKGTLLAILLITTILSNLAQAMMPDLDPPLTPLSGTPHFVGMSGAVYGLFGYIWITGRLDPGSGMYLHPQTVLLMIGWAFLCLVAPAIGGNVANTAHFGGLLTGVACAQFSLRQSNEP